MRAVVATDEVFRSIIDDLPIGGGGGADDGSSFCRFSKKQIYISIKNGKKIEIYFQVLF